METNTEIKTTVAVPVEGKRPTKIKKLATVKPAAKSKRTRKPKDDEQLALDKQIAELRDTFKKNRASGSILTTILLKRLPRMTFEHEAQLFKELCKRHTAELPLETPP